MGKSDIWGTYSKISVARTEISVCNPIILFTGQIQCLSSIFPELHSICRRLCLLQKVAYIVNKQINPKDYLLSAVICSSVSPPLSSCIMYSFSFSSLGFMRKLLRKMSGGKRFLDYLEENAEGKEKSPKLSRVKKKEKEKENQPEHLVTANAKAKTQSSYFL